VISKLAHTRPAQVLVHPARLVAAGENCRLDKATWIAAAVPAMNRDPAAAEFPAKNMFPNLDQSKVEEFIP